MVGSSISASDGSIGGRETFATTSDGANPRSRPLPERTGERNGRSDHRVRSFDFGFALIYVYPDVYRILRGTFMRVAKWGNSLAVRLPASVVDALGLKEGDEIEIHVADEREFGVSRKPGREELLKRLRAFRGRLPADFKFDRDEANAR